MKRTRLSLAVLLLAGVAVTGLTGSNAALAGPTVKSFDATKTVTRSFLDATGKQTVVSSKNVHVKINQITGLRGRQDINVSWSGAQPTGGIQADLNGVLADQQEYPMVLVECRGVDDGSAPASKQASPRTCWTHGSDARYVASNNTAFGPWRVDRYAAAADRAAYVGRPAGVDDVCPHASGTEHWLPFRALSGVTYGYGNQSCAGLPPEDFNYDSSLQVVPQNATFAPTRRDGTGSVKFDVWTDAENSSLGCNAGVACTLEIVPVMGISCDPYATAPGVPAQDRPDPTADFPRDTPATAAARCEKTGSFDPGTLANQSQSPDQAVSGQLWWSASNWRNRISVPLSFAPVSSACSQVGAGAPTTVYGSELLNEATAQWAPYFCLNPKLFKLTHVQTAEPLAQRLLDDPSSGVRAAFASSPPGTPFATPTVQAPVAATGFSISYNVDNTSGQAVATLRLNPRLLAKLLTESYPGDNFDRFAAGQFGVKNADGSPGSDIHDNPYNITQDPAFQALNPGIDAGFGLPGPATLIALSAESDVTQALTSYIDADPEARAWLNGKPDPWGMVVNHFYKGIRLPVLRWPLLDTTLPDFGGQVPCTKVDPAPWLPLLASPTPTLATTTVDVQFASSPGRNACTLTGDVNDPSNQLYQWTSTGRMQPGLRFVLGVTSLGEASRYDLNTAELQSTATVPNPGAKFTNASGRTFVSSSTASLAAAASHLAKSNATKTWSLSSKALQRDSKAYPGFMLVNADIPTSGLSKALATDYADLLSFASARGQASGLGNGDLPPGYLPLTRGNHLGAQAAYTVRAAAAVRAQLGVVPGLDPAATVSTATDEHSGGSTGTSSGDVGNGTPGGTGGGNVDGTSAPTGRSAAPTPGNTTSAPPASSAPSAVALSVRTPKNGFGGAGVVLPLILGAAALSGLAAGGIVWGPRGRR